MDHKSKLFEYVYAHLASTLWSLLLLLGGAVFVGYFAHIEYMPELDLSSSAAIIATAAISALILAVLLLVVLIFPGASWAGTIGSTSKIKSLWLDKDGKPSIKGTAIWFGIPLVTFYFCGVGAILIGWFSLLILLPVVVGSFVLAKRNTELLGWPLAIDLTLVWGAAFISAIFAFLPFCLIYLLATTADPQGPINRWIITLAVVVLVAFVNLAAAAKPDNVKSLLWYGGLGAIALFMILMQFGRFHVIPSRIIQIYKFGNIESAEVVVSLNACKGLSALNVQHEAPGDVCIISGVTILSRLGREFYVEAERKESGKLRFAIPAEAVISWAIPLNDTSKPNQGIELTR